MTDFSENFPDAVLMIRDNGGPPANPNVEFWFWAGNQSINYGFVQFEKRVNNVTTIFSVGIAAHAGWIRVSTDNAIWDQYVTLQLDTNLGIFNHGSADPGYPYTYTIHVARPVPPDAPTGVNLSNISVNSMVATWYPGYNGGATILGYQLGYGTNSSGPTTIINANPGVTVNNLATGTVYYFWARAQNYQGWGPWSGASSARTYLGMYVRVGGVWKLSIPYVRVSGVWKEVEPRVRVSGVWK